jgi:hypothetical protein
VEKVRRNYTAEIIILYKPVRDSDTDKNECYNILVINFVYFDHKMTKEVGRIDVQLFKVL